MDVVGNVVVGNVVDIVVDVGIVVDNVVVVDSVDVVDDNVVLVILVEVAIVEDPAGSGHL